MTSTLNVPALGASVATAFAATGVVRAVAVRRGAVDPVDPARKLHDAPTPRLGGLGIALGLAAGLLVSWTLGSPDMSWLGVWVRREARPDVVVVLAAALGVGLLDDLMRRRGGLPALGKLALQVAVGVLAVTVAGARFDGRESGPWPALPVPDALAVPLTVAWFVAVMNVVNFMDGSDALVGSMAIVILGAAGSSEPVAAGATLLPLAAATFGFLAWNAPPARIFMGDGGSHLLGAGIAMAACAIRIPEAGTEAPGALWPLVGGALLPAVLDVTEALVHKVRHGIPLSVAHHDHLYQRLVKATGSHGAVALRYAALTLAAVLAVVPLATAAGPVVACAAGAAVLVLHYVEGRRRTRGVPRLTRP